MEWIRGPTLGRGSSATVSLATTASGDLFAVKSIELLRASFLQKEQHFLSQLSSPYIVKYMGFDITHENTKPMYNLFMEYVPGGTISDAIKNQGGSLDESIIRLYTHQILLGLNYLHLNGLAHCDIKGQNVLIGKSGAKIADLGCARSVEGGDPATSTFSGTPVFMAPEVARGEEQSFPADMWALGCTVIEMATGSNPWPDVVDPVSALYRIGHSGDVPEFPTRLSEEAKDFLSKCLKRDAKDRWTALQLLQHPFFSDLDSDDSDQVEVCIRKSPTSVLDQSFWDSLEVSGPSRSPTRIGCSPAGRIRQLVGGTFPAGPSLPNWEDEEDWITLRSNHIEESPEISEMDYDLGPDETQFSPMESFMFSFVNVEEELEGSIGNGDLLFECPFDDISNDNSFSSDPDVSVSRILNFGEKVNTKNFSVIQFHFTSLFFNFSLH